jgi:hypothetical protein
MQCGTRSQDNVHPRQLNSAAALEQEKTENEVRGKYTLVFASHRRGSESAITGESTLFPT